MKEGSQLNLKSNTHHTCAWRNEPMIESVYPSVLFTSCHRIRPETYGHHITLPLACVTNAWGWHVGTCVVIMKRPFQGPIPKLWSRDQPYDDYCIGKFFWWPSLSFPNSITNIHGQWQLHDNYVFIYEKELSSCTKYEKSICDNLYGDQLPQTKKIKISH